jgi:hypothetical protein
MLGIEQTISGESLLFIGKRMPEDRQNTQGSGGRYRRGGGDVMLAPLFAVSSVS